jgi:hypothetical protein
VLCCVEWSYVVLCSLVLFLLRLFCVVVSCPVLHPHPPPATPTLPPLLVLPPSFLVAGSALPSLIYCLFLLASLLPFAKEGQREEQVRRKKQ